MAREIRDLIERGDGVWDEKDGWKQRPARAGDIIVLVRKRDGLFNEIIRQLKINNVPVAGADRMTLPDQLVVEDMLSLARFALLPDDDLALAETLKSPVFHPVGAALPPIDEEVLYALAHDRGGKTLWERLQASTDPRLAEAREALKAIRARVDMLTPYAFFARFLHERSHTGETRAARIYARLREEARDPLEAFLTRALSHEREGAPSLARFIDDMVRSSGELKREAEAGRKEVRVMTVHGAKGLEAPIVFLPDTNSAAAKHVPSLLPDETCGLIWRETDPFANADVKALEESWTADQEAESARLLYVAMTRARDRLVVCGYMPGNTKKLTETGWYKRLDEAWQGAQWQPVDTAIDTIAAKHEWPQTSLAKARRFGPTPKAVGQDTEQSDRGTELPDWARQSAPREALATRPVAPSSLLAGLEAGAEPNGLSPLAEGGKDRFVRGTLIHKLLQILPDIAPDRRGEMAAGFLSRQDGLTDEARAAIASEALGLVANPRFAALFAPRLAGGGFAERDSARPAGGGAGQRPD